MRSISPPLLRRGAVQTVHPDPLDARGIDAASAEVALTRAGGLLIRSGGGLFSAVRMLELPADALQITPTDGGFCLSGGPIRRLQIPATCTDSSVHRVLTALTKGTDPQAAWGPPEGRWTLLGAVHVVAQRLADDPRQPPVGRAVGRPRGLPLLWRDDEGALWVDDPTESLHVPAPQVLAIHPTDAAAGHSWIHRVVLPDRDGWIVGLRINAPESLPIEARGQAPAALAVLQLRGSLDGAPAELALASRDDDGLSLWDAQGLRRCTLAPEALRWTWAGRLLLSSARARLSAELERSRARWLLEGLPRDDALIEVCDGRTGVTRARVEARALAIDHLSGPIPLEHVTPDDVTLSTSDTGAQLRLADQLALHGKADTLATLREAILSQVGRQQLQRLSPEALLQRWRALQIERWLFLIYGPIFVTEEQLDQVSSASDPSEPDEAAQRRAVITETLIVAQQVRSVRLRLGAVPLVLPHALQLEEAGWLGPLLGPDAQPHTISPRAFQQHLREVLPQLSFAVAEVERAVARLEPVHFPELHGGASVWGNVGLGAALMMLAPITGTVTIARAVVGKMSDRVNKESGSRTLVDRFGPECRSGWSLLVEITSVAASQTQAFLARELSELPCLERAEPEALRSALIEQILELQGARFAPLTALQGRTVGEVSARMVPRLEVAPRQLVERLTGRGLGAVTE